MILRVVFYKRKKILFTLNLKDCDYQDFKKHFLSFIPNGHYRIRFYEIENNNSVLKVDHIV